MAEAGAPTAARRQGAARAGFPWAFAAAVLIVLAVEAALHVAPPRVVMPYARGLQEYSSLTACLDKWGPAELVFVGSSRVRMGISAPEATRLLRESGKGWSVGNYGLSAANAADTEAAVRYILRCGRKPRMVVFGLAPRDYRCDEPFLNRIALFWDYGDFEREYAANPVEAGPLLPVVLRNQMGRIWLTLRYRQKFRQWGMGLLRRRERVRIACPIIGEKAHDEKEARRSLVTHPLQPGAVEAYVQRQLDHGRFVFDDVMVESVRRTIAMCREAGVELVLFELPMSEPLRRTLPEGTTERFMRITRDLADAGRVRFITLDELGAEFAGADFIEQSHLNEAGALKLTRALMGHLADGGR